MSPLEPGTTALSLTEKHLNQWLDLLDHLHDAHAPTDELKSCHRQIALLQQNLYLLQAN